MGIGMILVVGKDDVDVVRKALLNAGEANSVVMGEIVAGEPAVEYI
jgi:phosphoribosylaminoimidazole (AIR) synthetase